MIADCDDRLVKRDDVERMVGQVLHLRAEHGRRRRQAEADPIAQVWVDADVVVEKDRHMGGRPRDRGGDSGAELPNLRLSRAWGRLRPGDQAVGDQAWHFIRGVGRGLQH